MPRSLAAVASGASLRIGDSGMSCPRSEMFGIVLLFFVFLATAGAVRHLPLQRYIIFVILPNEMHTKIIPPPPSRVAKAVVLASESGSEENIF